MAIKYLAGERLIGTAAERTASLGTLASTGWTLTPTYSTVSGGTLNIQNNASNQQHYASYDLGDGNISSNWVLRFKIIFDK